MEPKTKGLHHITAITSDASSAVKFYTRILGLRLVKKTVNFDWFRLFCDSSRLLRESVDEGADSNCRNLKFRVSEPSSGVSGASGVKGARVRVYASS